MTLHRDLAAPMAHLGGMLATDLVDVSNDPNVLDTSGRWAVVMTFEGDFTAARFRSWTPASLPVPATPWRGPSVGGWDTSLDRDTYVKAVSGVRQLIAAGTVYQVNVCRVLSAAMPTGDRAILPLAARLAAHHRAPFAGLVDVPPIRVVCASPELFLRRDEDRIVSSPIKGTGRVHADLTTKDAAENVMIVDLVRNDLSQVCRTGSIAVDSLLAVEDHPGLVHLVSTVSGRLRTDVGWTDILAATFPPGSVSGAPKSSALQAIADLEPVPRGPYCGAVGWVDADRGLAELAVGIRTFWERDGVLRFGTGAGITWGSDPEHEWRESELKAERLIGLASC